MKGLTHPCLGSAEAIASACGLVYPWYTLRRRAVTSFDGVLGRLGRRCLGRIWGFRCLDLELNVKGLRRV